MKNISLMITASLLAVAGQADAASLKATAATLQSVIASAKGGDTVTLSGTFGRTTLSNKNFTSLVTIDATAASFTDTLVLSNVGNIAIDGGHYGSATAMTSWNRAVVVTGATNISFTNPTVVGYYGGQGIYIADATNATVTGAALSKLDAGVVFNGVTGGSISNSRSTAATSDGFDITNSSHVDIGNNSCTGGTPTIGAHPDCVQLWSSAGSARQDHIAIHNNYASGGTQGFTDFASFGIGADYISMTNNRVDGLFSQGVACYSCSNSTITGNTLTSLDGAQFQDSLNVVNGLNNIVSGNVIGKWNAKAAKPTVYYDRNLLVGGKVHAPALGSLAGAVPEPYTWAMMVAGFGLVGFSQRRQRYVAA